MDIKLLLLYFVIGGVIVAAVTYFGGQARGEVAAFIAFLPSISVITLITVYLAGGTQGAVSYAKSMLLLLPPWVLYVVAVIFLLPKIGLASSLVVSIAIYLGFAYLIMRLV